MPSSVDWERIGFKVTGWPPMKVKVIGSALVSADVSVLSPVPDSALLVSAELEEPDEDVPSSV